MNQDDERKTRRKQGRGTARSPGGRDAILKAALRLFGERGIETVSTAEILQVAGQRNQTALQYHFGSREGLYAAILQEYLAPIDDARVALFATAGEAQASLDLCLRVMVEPLIEVALKGEDGIAYLRFLRQFTARPGFELTTLWRRLNYPGMVRLIAELDHHFGPLPVERRNIGIGLLLQISVVLLLNWQQDLPGAVDRAGLVGIVVATGRAMIESMVRLAPPAQVP